jgi:hypothetical protein
VSRDGRLPDNVSEADFDRAFPPDCPDECASNHPIYGTDGTLLGQLRGWLFGAYIIDPAPDCDCPSPAEIRAEREEARAEAREG